MTAFNPGSLVASLQRLRNDSEAGIIFIHDSVSEDRLSYRDLYELAAGALCRLQELGLDSGDELVIQLEDNKQLLIVFWACMLGGIIAIPLTMGSREEHKRKLVNVWRQLHAPYVVTDEANRRRLQEYPLVMEGRIILYEDLAGEPDAARIRRAIPESIAYIQYSSGSTGDPKGVVLTHGNLISNGLDIISRSGISAADRMLSWMPLTHDMGMICCHLTGVLAGVAQFLLPTAVFIRRPLLWMEKASAHRISLLYSPNFGYEYFLQAYEKNGGPGRAKWDLSTVRLIYNGAEPVSYALCNRFLATLAETGLSANCIFPGYGLAEASVAVTLPKPGQELICYRFDRASLDIGRKAEMTDTAGKGIPFVALGTALSSCSVRIADRRDTPVPDGYLGHVQIKGLNVTSGYYGNEQLTREMQTADGWTKTGDLGLLIDGALVITGRWKNIIIINGQNYYPQDIEAVALAATGLHLHKLIACGVYDTETGGDRLMIFAPVNAKGSGFGDLAAVIRKAVYAEMGLVVDAVVRVPKVPKTTSGKIQYHRLVEKYRNGEYPEVAVAGREEKKGEPLPTAPADGAIAAKIVALLGIHPGITAIAADDSFFDIGITSLEAVRVVNALNAEYGSEIGLQDFFVHHSANLLAGRIAGTRSSEAAMQAILSHNPTGFCHLSATQARFLVLQQILASAAPFNISLAYSLCGTLDIDCLQDAFRQLVCRHDSLRTFIDVEDGHPIQRIRPVEELQAFLQVIRVDQATTGAGGLAAFLLENCRKEFDLGTGPLYRFILVVTGTREFTLLLVVHHLIADGWSLSVIARELSANYSRLLAGVTAAIQPPELQFTDFVRWSGKTVAGEEYHRAKLYWLDKLNGLGGPAPLPFTRKTASVPVPAIAAIPVPRQLVEKMMVIGRERRTTLFTELLAVCFIVLHKLTGQHDLVIGSTAAGRTRQELEGQIGCFIKTLVLRLQLEKDDDYHTVLSRTGETIAEALKFHEYPFEHLIEERQDRKLQPVPFNVLFQLHDTDRTLRLEGTEVEELYLEPAEALADLEFVFTSKSGELHFTLNYNKAVFDHTDIARLSALTLDMLQKVVASPDVPVTSHEIITAAERDILLNRYNDTRQDYRTGETFLDHWSKQVQLRREHPALFFEGATYSYEQLDERSDAVAAALMDNWQIRAGDHIAIAGERSAWTVIGIIGILKCGAAYVPLDPFAPSARIDYILRDCAVRLVLTPAMLSRPGGVAAAKPALPVVLPDHTAYVMYTSGTTGRPKGVVIRHASLCDYLQTFNGFFGVNESDIVIHQASPAFDTSVEELFPILSAGGKLAVSGHGAGDIEQLVCLIEDAGATIVSATPMVLQELNKYAHRLHSLRAVISGGEKLYGHHIDRLFSQTAIYNTYGPTETTVCATYYPIDRLQEELPIGKPIGNKRIYILDDAGHLVPPGFTGEICIAGSGLAKGYQGDAALTAQRFRANPFEPGTRIYHSGDLGRWLSDGSIGFLGRKDSQVKVRGYRVDLREVESALRRHPAVADVVMDSKTVPNGSCSIIAYCRSESGLAPAELRAYLSAGLPWYMLPERLIVVREFPLTVRGKADLAALALLTETGGAGDTDVEPRSPQEKRLLEIWQDVFGTTAINVLSGLFDAGGDSIRAFALIARVRKEMHVLLPVKEIFSGASIRELAARFAVPAGGEGYQRPGKAGIAEYYRTAHAQRRLWMAGLLDRSTTSSNLNWSFDLRGRVDNEVLLLVFRELIERHENLRSSFVVRDGELLQRPGAQSPGAVLYKDLRSAEDPRATAHAVTKAEKAATLRLEDGCLFRARLLHLREDEMVLVITMHHIIADGWSVDLMIEEIQVLYADGICGRPVSLAAPDVEYKDYAAWEADEILRCRRMGYPDLLKERLLGSSPASLAPGMAGRNAVRNYNRSDSVRLLAGEKQSREIIRFTREHRLGLPALITGALHALLYAKGHRTPIVTGLMLNGRSAPALQGIVGFFVNTLPMISDAPGSETCAALLNRLQEDEVQLIDRQYFPYDLLSGEAATGKPLFHIVVSSMMHGRADKPRFEQVQVSEFEPRSSWRTDFELSCCLEQAGDSIGLNMLFDREVLDRRLVERIGWELLTVIGSIIRMPDRRVDQLEPVWMQPVAATAVYGHQSFLVFPASKNALTGLERVYSREYDARAELLPLITTAAAAYDISVSGLIAGILGIMLAKYNFCRELMLGLDMCGETFSMGNGISVSFQNIGDIVLPVGIDMRGPGGAQAVFRDIGSAMEENRRRYPASALKVCEYVLATETVHDGAETDGFVEEERLQRLSQEYHTVLLVFVQHTEATIRITCYSHPTERMRGAIRHFVDSFAGFTLSALAPRGDNQADLTDFAEVDLEVLMDTLLG